MTALVERSNGYIVYDANVGEPAVVVASAQIAEKIIDRVLPRWRSDIPKDPAGLWQQHREAAIRAVSELRSRDEVATKLGDDAPDMNAAAMHPWAWEAARSLWQSGHFREAVRAAAVKVNAELQNKVGRRDASEVNLFQQSFSDDMPLPGKPRLRPEGDDGGKTSLSLRRGIVAFAEGCYAAIRNPASHDEGDLGEQIAMEQLAAFSVLARWVDAATVDAAG